MRSTSTILRLVELFMMRSLRDRCTRSTREMTCPASAVISLRKEAMRCGALLCTAVLVAAFFEGMEAAAKAQNTGRPRESPLMRQLHQAVSLAEHGDQQGAMQLDLRMLQQNPKFVPAMKLKGMLLEEGGRTAEAAAVYEEALKLAPNDGDLLLKAGMFKLAAGEKEEALSLLLHCSRILPGDGDAQYYLAQAYHLNGQEDLALRAIQQSLKTGPDNASVQQKYGELLCSTGNNQEGLRWLLKAHRADAKLPRIDYE